MGIKVRNIKNHTITYPDNNDGLPQMVTMDVPVVEGKLLLIETHWEENKYLIFKKSDGRLFLCEPFLGINSDGDSKGKCYKPIIISETENIESGDKWWMPFTGDIIHTKEDKDYGAFEPNGMGKKVLVLPEQFSPEHMQAIVDGKMKNGDKVLVECEKVYHPNPEDRVEHRYKWRYEVKLNSNYKTTLHRVEEEEKYTRDEVITFCYKYHNFIKAMEGNRTAPEKFQITHMSSDEWFQKHIK